MIVTMLMFNIVTFAFLTVFYDGIPVWLRIVLYAIIFISAIIACASEDNLRNKNRAFRKRSEELKKGR